MKINCKQVFFPNNFFVSLVLSPIMIKLGKTHIIFFLVVEPLKGGRGKTPRTTKKKDYFIKKKWPTPHEPLSSRGEGNLFLVVCPLKKIFFMCFLPKLALHDYWKDELFSLLLGNKLILLRQIITKPHRVLQNGGALHWAAGGIQTASEGNSCPETNKNC